jgi:tetratricopeptide (TPR) repeat protein
VDLALLWAYVHEKKYTEILAVTERLSEAAPTSAWLFVTRFNALSRLGRSAEARRLAEERLGRLPDDPPAVRSLAGELARSGDVPGALRLERRLVARGSATAIDYNDIAWFALVEEKVDEQAIRDGQRAVEMSGSSGYASLHTLASLYAETGKTTEARELILKAIAENGREEPRPDDWYVFGRIAEQYGESAAAIDAYGRVEAPAAKDLIPTSTWALAKRRLAVLGASGAPPRKKG